MYKFQHLGTTHADFSPVPHINQPVLHEVAQMLHEIVQALRPADLPPLDVRIVGMLVTCYVSRQFGPLAFYSAPFIAAVLSYLQDHGGDQDYRLATSQVSDWQAKGAEEIFPGEYPDTGRIIAFFNVDDNMLDHVMVSVSVFHLDARFRPDQGEPVQQWKNRYPLNQSGIPGFFTEMSREMHIEIESTRRSTEALRAETAQIKANTIRVREAAQRILEDEADANLMLSAFLFPDRTLGGQC
jgi:hypothetical protein